MFKKKKSLYEKLRKQKPEPENMTLTERELLQEILLQLIAIRERK